MVGKVVNGESRTSFTDRVDENPCQHRRFVTCPQHDISARGDSFTSRKCPYPCINFRAVSGISYSLRGECHHRPGSLPIPQRSSASPGKLSICFPSRSRSSWRVSHPSVVLHRPGRPTRRRFGYELTFFRRGMPREQTKTLPSKWAVTHLYLAIFLASVASKDRFHDVDKMSRAGLGKAGAAQDHLHVWIDQWSVESPSAAPGTLRSSRQQRATSPSTSQSRRKTACRAWHRRNQPQRLSHRTSLALLFLHQTDHDRHAHDRSESFLRGRHKLDGP